jgi:hypothetical protein
LTVKPLNPLWLQKKAVASPPDQKNLDHQDIIASYDMISPYDKPYQIFYQEKASALAETHPVWLSCCNNCDVVACGGLEPVQSGRAIITNNQQCHEVRRLHVYVSSG